jgi:hypothetical protein
LLWEARIEGLSPIFGEPDDYVMHSPVPLYLGGNADVLRFRNHCGGVAYVTADLTGIEQPDEGQAEQFELVICHRSEDDWGPNIISQLAKYTLETRLNPFETMDIGSAIKKRSKITAFLFVDYGKFNLLESQCGLLLCLGITAQELKLCREEKSRLVLEKIKNAGVYPFTDLKRDTVPGID